MSFFGIHIHINKHIYIYFFLLLYKGLKLVSGGSFIKGAYTIYFIHISGGTVASPANQSHGLQTNINVILKQATAAVTPANFDKGGRELDLHLHCPA